jgi:CHAT domain-containing protein
VIVGDPAFDRALFAELEPLRGAPREATEVGAAYPDALRLDAAGATKPAVLRALQRATLLHFAGHARLVERAPDLSHLVLARAPGGFEANRLTAGEIARLDLRRLRLVVLSSCGTTQPRSRRDDAEGGLADAFLDAGAAAVVSSLWEADDAEAVALMRELHAALRAGAEGAEALRRAQVRMARAGPGGGTPRTWSAFRYEDR